MKTPIHKLLFISVIKMLPAAAVVVPSPQVESVGWGKLTGCITWRPAWAGSYPGADAAFDEGDSFAMFGDVTEE